MRGLLRCHWLLRALLRLLGGLSLLLGLPPHRRLLLLLLLRLLLLGLLLLLRLLRKNNLTRRGRERLHP